MQEFDYIIVGAGSAGCVLADKLSETGRHRVLVLEAGGSDKLFWVKVPIGYGKNFYSETLNWKYETEPCTSLNGQKSYWPRGKILGGSSSINAMCYARGLPTDFDEWRDMGNIGWGWSDVKTQYDRFERFVDVPGASESDNPLYISNVYKDMHPLKEYFRDAASDMGFDYLENMNGDQTEGFAAYQINTKNGIRWSSTDAFLYPASKRHNVAIETRAHVKRVLFKGKRAIGVEYAQNGMTKKAYANGEVILSGGAINSPMILQHSGIGCGELLQKYGIKNVHENVQVGRNMQDHIGINYYYIANIPTLNDELHGWGGKIWAGMKYILSRRGPLSLSVNQNGGFVRSNDNLDRPNLQLYFNPISYSTTVVEGKRPLMNPDPYSGFIMSFQPCRPTSRGHLKIKSSDPFDPPEITPNYLSTDEDIVDVVEGGRFIRRLAQTPTLQGLIDEVLDPSLEGMDDEGIVADFRKRAGTVFHPSCTCMMGVDPKTAVVSPELKVHGIDKLRVVDTSVFPTITSGNTHAPTVMVAHMGANSILKDAH